MDHVAIMKPQLGFLEKILSGSKSMESRWYKKRITPWKNISRNDTVYFKNSGKNIYVKSNVSRVEFLPNINSAQILEVLQNFKNELGIDNIEDFFAKVENKKYCILITLTNIEKIPEFKISKICFGQNSAWISIDNINEIIIK